jgi:outer membrane protein assembly factor BamB
MRQDGKFFWPDASNREKGLLYTGPPDLMANISWGWHHPSGIYSTIPVGSPLIDDQSNIYIGSDDAIRKFDVTGVIKWSYAPRGQLAAAPSLCVATSRRQAASMTSDISDKEKENEMQQLLRPDWANGNGSDGSSQLFSDFKVGDTVKVKPGASFWADGRELYRAGDKGLISGLAPDGEGGDGRAVIQWTRTGRKSVVELHAIKNRFVRVETRQATLPPMLVGSTTSGYVFALDLDSGDELWVTWASSAIAGVKGAVGCKGGVVVVATDRCTDRYCYRYRNQTNPLTPGNSFVRGLSAVDGAALWEYKTFQPVWNMVPLWGQGNSVFFQDWEGRLYCLDYLTGSQTFRVGGDIGTHSHAHAVYDPGHNVVIAMGVKHYTGGRCNPYPAPGILPSCWTWPGTPGFIRGYNAISGNRIWDLTTPEPPASAAVGMLNSPEYHTRLVVTMGHNCYMNAKSQIWGLDPNDGDWRWKMDGPTLWSTQCAGDKEGADIRRAMGGREKCHPNSWSMPAIDSLGDVYVGSQVGVLQRWGSPNPGAAGSGVGNRVALLSSLTTGVAFQDAAIAFGEGVMAVSTCTSLIVFQSYTQQFPQNGTAVVSHDQYSASPDMVHGEQISHTISEESHGDISVTPKHDSDDIWSNDQPFYDPNVVGNSYGGPNADNHPLEWSPTR